MAVRRMTRQGKAILKVMRRFARERYHPTADEVYRAVKRELPRISLPTVYRNLERLAEQGEIRKLDIPNFAARFDGETKQHHHIRCVVCGRVDDLPFKIRVRLPADAAVVEGYEVIGHNAELLGVCRRCRRGERG